MSVALPIFDTLLDSFANTPNGEFVRSLGVGRDAGIIDGEIVSVRTIETPSNLPAIYVAPTQTLADLVPFVKPTICAGGVAVAAVAVVELAIRVLS